MTPSELKSKVEQTGSNSHFFTRKTMQFFGDRMNNFGARKTKIETWSDGIVEVYELYRKRPVKHGLQSSHYFDAETFESRFTKK